jgi:hypothetical protein
VRPRRTFHGPCRPSTMALNNPAPRSPARLGGASPGRMHGTIGDHRREARYYCSTQPQEARLRPAARRRTAHRGAGRAVPLRRSAEPGDADEILDRLANGEDGDTADVARKRRQLNERRKRLRDLYELDNLDRSEYVSKRDAVDAELEALRRISTEHAPCSRTSDASGRRRPTPKRLGSCSSSSSSWSESTARRSSPTDPCVCRPFRRRRCGFAAGCKRRERRDSNPGLHTGGSRCD